MKSFTVTLFLSIVLLATGFSQTARFVENELIVQLHPDQKIQDLQIIQQRRSIATRAIFSATNVHKIHLSENDDLLKVKTQLERDPAVAAVQLNYYLTRRGSSSLEPNDPLYSEQWNLRRIGLPELWNDADGSTTPCGDEIVIAVFDFGLDMTHEDIQDNLWENAGEIANNGFDDDQNGYVDDRFGVNLETGNDKHAVADDYHGTGVASVIAAGTDNGVGMAGVAWSSKLMVISSEDKTVDLALEAFQYVMDMRALYESSGGTEGAYVVAINNSWGYEGGFEEDFPILCGSFNTLGAAGILAVGATENDQVNTDVFGDIPSDCSSDFLIVVTNTDEQDELAVGGFGTENVDLGAPGENIRVAGPDQTYKMDGGTSFSTPHVSGAIGLLYSIPEATFCDNATLDKEETLRSIKKYILDGVTPVPTLDGRSVSGGRLNLENTFDMVTGNRELVNTQIMVGPNPTQSLLNIDISNFNTEVEYIRIYDILGTLIQTLAPSSKSKNIQIDMSPWPNGTYMVKVHGGAKTGLSTIIKH